MTNLHNNDAKLPNFDSFFVAVDEFDSYIIVSFVNATLVLSIGETVEEVTDSGFLGTTPTLSCSALGDDALVQVQIGIFFIRLPPEFLPVSGPFSR